MLLWIIIFKTTYSSILLDQTICKFYFIWWINFKKFNIIAPNCLETQELFD